MLLDRRARFLIKQDMHLRPLRGKGAALRLQAEGQELDVLTILRDRVAAGTAETSLRGGDTLSVTAVELLSDRGMAVLLFRRADANASTQHFQHRRTKALRPSDKDPEEDPAVSAHLFVNLSTRVGHEHTHRAIIEEVPGLSVSYIRPFLNLLLRERRYPSMDRRGREVEASTIIDLAGLPSQSIGDALNGGGIDFVELVRPPNLGGLDAAGLRPSPERLRFGLRRGDGADPLGIITRLRTWASHQGWADMRVQIVTNDQRHRTVEVGRGEDAASILFIQAERRETRNDLPACSEVVNDELIAHAEAMFASDLGWV